MGGRDDLPPKPPAWTAGTLARSLAAIVPMAPGLSRMPFTDANWSFELVRGGPRALLAFGDGPVALVGRDGLDLLPWFPDVVAPLREVGGGITVLDGELCVLDAAGRHHPELLHRRALQRPRGAWEPGQRASFCVRDLLVLAGEDLRDRPWVERRARLRRLASVDGDAVRPLRDVDGDGRWLARQAAALPVPGVLARRLDAPYGPGPQPAWVTVQLCAPADEEKPA